MTIKIFERAINKETDLVEETFLKKLEKDNVQTKYHISGFIYKVIETKQELTYLKVIVEKV